MSKLAVARVIIALIALLLMLAPGEVWSRPEADFEKEGFDANLHYVQPRSRQIFDPFLILENGTWKPCPCPPAEHLAIVGKDLVQRTSRDRDGEFELAGTSVLVNGQAAKVFLVTPSQVNFVLPDEIASPVANISLLVDGQVRGEDAVGIETASEEVESAQVAIENDMLALEALAGREPAVHLITTPLSFRASFIARVIQQAGSSVPVRIELWNPRNFSSFSIIFSPERQIEVILSENRGQLTRHYDFGEYQLDKPYEITFEWQRGKEASIILAGSAGERTALLRAEDSLALFDAYRPSLTALASGGDSGSSATLTDYHLTLLPERFTTVKADDGKIAPIMMLVVAAGMATFAIPFVSRHRRPSLRDKWASFLRGLREQWPPTLAGWRLGLIVLGALAFLAINAALFGLGSHPFDMGSQKIWTYIAVEYGIPDLYYLAQTAPLAEVWNGTPYHEAVFPYNIGMSYYFWFIGQFHQLFFGHVSPDSLSLEYMIKSFNLIFMVLDAALVYAIMRHLRPSSSILPWAAVGLVLFNPAFVFDTAVWGETESVPLFFLLGSALAALKQRPTLAWSMLALAFLTKQTVLIPILMMAGYYLFRFHWRANLKGISVAVILASLASLFVTLNGYTPSIALDPTLAALKVHGGTGAEKVFQVVSYDAFNVWTLVTLLRDGAHGLSRFQFPDHLPALGSLSYHDIGSGLLVLSIVGILVWLVVHRKETKGLGHSLFLVMALAFLAELVLPTRPVSRYFIFPLVFILFGLAGRTRWLSVSAYAALSVTTLVGVYGSMASVFDSFPQQAPLLAPENNPLSAGILYLFRSDTFYHPGRILECLLAVGSRAGSLLQARSHGAAGVTARTASAQREQGPTRLGDAMGPQERAVMLLYVVLLMGGLVLTGAMLNVVSALVGLGFVPEFAGSQWPFVVKNYISDLMLWVLIGAMLVSAALMLKERRLRKRLAVTPRPARGSLQQPRIAVALTAYNDELSIGDAVLDFKDRPGVETLIVVDNNSRDATAACAATAGALVVRETNQGYGYACIRGLKEALETGADIIVLSEGDCTFSGHDIAKLVPFLEDADLVVGNRITPGLVDRQSQMDTFFVWGNQIGAKLIQLRFWDWRFLGKLRLSDLGCTFRAMRREALAAIIDELKVGGNHFSPHMIMVSLRKGHTIVEVPVTFWPRVGVSKGASNFFKALGIGFAMFWHILSFPLKQGQGLGERPRKEYQQWQLKQSGPGFTYCWPWRLLSFSQDVRPRWAPPVTQPSRSQQ